MKKNQLPLTARVVARRMEDLERLAANSSMTMCCGSVGRLIGRKVLEGKGVATIDLNLIRLAIDADCGHNQLLDNFNILGSRNYSPLLYQLINEKLEAHRELMKKS